MMIIREMVAREKNCDVHAALVFDYGSGLQLWFDLCK